MSYIGGAGEAGNRRKADAPPDRCRPRQAAACRGPGPQPEQECRPAGPGGSAECGANRCATYPQARGGGGGRGGRGGPPAALRGSSDAAIRRGAAPALGPGAGRGPWGLGPQGLPLVKPPYGRITAYNLNSGDIVWQVANGETYDWIKNHPALKGVTIPKTGRADEGGIVVTKTLMFAGQGCGLFRSGAGGSEIFYAYDKATGAVVHEMTIPGGTCGNPMTYAINGKQYIAVSVGSRTTTAEIVALALPNRAPAGGRAERYASALVPFAFSDRVGRLRLN